MDNKKDNRYYLEKILTDLKFIIDYTKDKTLEEIASNEILIDSIMFRIIQVAESNIAIVYDTVKNGIPEMYAILSKI